MGSTPDNTVTIDGSGDIADSLVGLAMGFRGVDTTTPLDVVIQTAKNPDTWTANPPSVDYLDADAWTVMMSMCAHARNSGVTLTLPTGYVTDSYTLTADDINDTSMAIGYNSAPADPEDPGTVAVSGASDSTSYSWAAATLALRPAAAAGSIIPQIMHNRRMQQG